MTSISPPLTLRLALQPPRWRAALSALARDAETAPAAMELALVCEVQALIALAPHGGRGAAPDFAALLGAGAATSAVLALMPEGANFMFSRGEDGCLASLLLDSGEAEVTRRGASVALALAAALASALAGDGRAATADITQGRDRRQLH